MDQKFLQQLLKIRPQLEPMLEDKEEPGTVITKYVPGSKSVTIIKKNGQIFKRRRRRT